MNKLFKVVMALALVAGLVYFSPRTVHTTDEMGGLTVPWGHRIVAVDFINAEGDPHWVATEDRTWSGMNEFTYGSSAVMLRNISTDKYYMWVIDHNGRQYADLSRFTR